MSLIKRSIDTAAAERAIKAAKTKAAELAIHVSAAIVDEVGGLQALLRGDGALPITVEIATNEAYTSAVGGLRHIGGMASSRTMRHSSITSFMLAA